MIVSHEARGGCFIPPGAPTICGLLLREIETEAEAFAEMRRFNEVNNINSDETEVRWIEAINHSGKIIPRHKSVVMTTMFGIYYDDSKPPILELTEKQRDTERYDEVMKYFKDLELRKAGGG